MPWLVPRMREGSASSDILTCGRDRSPELAAGSSLFSSRVPDRHLSPRAGPVFGTGHAAPEHHSRKYGRSCTRQSEELPPTVGGSCGDGQLVSVAQGASLRTPSATEEFEMKNAPEYREHPAPPDDPNKAGGEPAQEKEEARKEAAAIVTNTAYIWSLALAVLALLLYIYWFR